MQLLLENSRFRWLWFGSACDELGIIMYFMAQGWLTLTITGSPFWVGATAGMGGLGLMSFSVVGGVLVDRIDRRRLIVIGQLIQAGMASGVAALALTGHIQLWELLAVGFIDGLILAVKAPATMAMTLDLVGRDRLLRAIGARFLSMTLMGIAAPLVLGGVVSALAIGWAYAIVAGARLVAAALISRIGPLPPREGSDLTAPWRDLKDGVRYVVSTPTVRTLLLMGLVGETFGWAHEAMLPVMARDVLDVGVSGYGYMLAVASAGGAVASLIVSSRREVMSKGRLLVVGACGFGLFLILFAYSPWFPLSMVLLAAAYGMVVAYEATLTTLLQTIVPDEMRGRVLSFQTLTWGMTGFSGFHTGAVAAAVGAPLAIGIGGVVVMLNALRLMLRRSPLRSMAVEEAGAD